jgi:hypothetical protein
MGVHGHLKSAVRIFLVDKRFNIVGGNEQRGGDDQHYGQAEEQLAFPGQGDVKKTTHGRPIVTIIDFEVTGVYPAFRLNFA